MTFRKQANTFRPFLTWPDNNRCALCRAARNILLHCTCSEGAIVMSQPPAATSLKHPDDDRRPSTPSPLVVVAAAAAAAAVAAVVVWMGAVADATVAPPAGVGHRRFGYHWTKQPRGKNMTKGSADSIEVSVLRRER